MNDQNKKAYWQKFVQTGHIEDYLRYKSGMGGDRPNPRRRISDSSKNKEFY